MAAFVKIQPQAYVISYPKTAWRIVFVEDATGKFQFRLANRDLKFEPRDRYRYPTHNDAKRAAICFLELLKRLERSRLRLGILAEIGILKFPQETYHGHELWLLVDRTRYTWEVLTVEGCCFRSRRWYKNPSTALLKAKGYIDPERAIAQIEKAVGWV